MSDLIFPTIVVVVVLVILSAAVGKNRDWMKTIRAKPMMTPREVAFFNLLKGVAAPLHVCPQVAMGAILAVAKGGEGKQRHATRNRFAQKMIDFVLIDDSGAVRLIIELDDRTHGAAKDASRDAMTARGGYQTLRVRGGDARTAQALRARISESVTFAVAG
ncbi:hypothetical protein GCM10011529_02350 [Polymorphobacter glacialis]|uniref:DUF2726 domain-containing protein n=1 Tax=Sandarakinorhabdus glacialis TaxID=1614636 RepID=A0A916ZII4_9SPHN|nr:DUF2726 domain-containing protein [Polymorphobacter glacialis]GGD99746.1 hypothetical protein GCM10011529_02350 [Polymorphobacter glacialis]